MVGCTYRGMPRHRAIVRNLIGANMSFRRNVYLRTEAFTDGPDHGRPELITAARHSVGAASSRHGSDAGGHRLEDTEFCVRASALWPNGVWIYEPRARVRHHVPASRTRWSYFRSRCYVEGLAKALVAQVAGAREGLRTESRYTVRTLPVGVLRGVCDTVFRLDPYGIARSASIIAGFAITAVGYARGALIVRNASAVSD